jgi:hypothetical protein
MRFWAIMGSNVTHKFRRRGNFSVVNSPWSEVTVDLITAPAISGTPFYTTGFSVGAASTFVTLDVTAEVQAWLNNPGSKLRDRDQFDGLHAAGQQGEHRHQPPRDAQHYIDRAAGTGGPAWSAGNSGRDWTDWTNRADWPRWNGRYLRIELSLRSARVMLPADGRTIPINGNTALFSLVGITYGGNGTTNYGLPDFRSAAPNGTTYLICFSGVNISRNPFQNPAIISS